MSGFDVTFNTQHRRWQYAKGIPKQWQPFFGSKVFGNKGQPFERRYLDTAPKDAGALAKRIAIIESEPYRKRDAAVIARLEALSDEQRAYVLAAGGYLAFVRRSDELHNVVADSAALRTIAEGINHRAPLPNAALVVGDSDGETDGRAWSGTGVAPIRDTGRHPIAFTTLGDKPRVVLPSAPTSWAELRADLGDWAKELASGAAFEQAKTASIKLNAEPVGAYSFEHGLLAVYVKRKGDKWRGKDTENSRHQDGLLRTVRLLRDVLGNIDYRDVTADDAAKFRDHLETLGKSYDWRSRQLSHAHRMYKAAVNLRTMDSNPFDGITPHGEAADDEKDKRGKFTPAHLRAILDTARKIKFGDTALEKRHALVMAALEAVTYTGAAPNEILCIQRGDIRKDAATGIYCLKITDKDCVTRKRHDLKSTKNRKSRPRLLPLHPKLSAFVALAYTDDESKRQEFVFEAFGWNKHKYRRGWFDQYFVPSLLKSCGVVPEAGETLSFYSMRHSMHDLIDNGDISRKRQLVLTGHAPEEVHEEYASGANLLKLYEDVKGLDPLADVALVKAA